MFPRAPGANARWVGPDGYRPKSDYIPLNDPATPAHIGYPLSSTLNYDSVLHAGHDDPPGLPNLSYGLHSGFSAANTSISPIFRSQLDGSGLLDWPSSYDIPPVHVNLYIPLISKFSIV